MEKFSLDKWLQDKSRKVVTRDGREVEIIHTNSPVPHHPIVGFIDKSIYTWTIDGKLIYGKKEQDENDLFFSDEEETLSALLTELKSYLENTPREQIEKDWKEIQDWYNSHCVNKGVDEVGLTDFELYIKGIIEAYATYEGHPYDMEPDNVRNLSTNILSHARKELQSEIDKEIDRAYHNQDEVVYSQGYKKGKEDAMHDISDFEIYEKGFKAGKEYVLKDLPTWKNIPSGICGNAESNPTFLIRTSYGHYFTFSCLAQDEDSMYLELTELEKIPKEK